MEIVLVLDRSDSMNGQEGPVCLEVKASLFDDGQKKVLLNYIYGLGGREMGIEEIKSIYTDLLEASKGKPKDKINYLGVRE